MNSKISYIERKDHLVVKIQPNPDKIVWVGVWFILMVFLLLMFLGFKKIAQEGVSVYSIILFSFLILLCIVPIRISLLRFYKKEFIVVYRDKMILYERFIYYKKKMVMKKKGIKSLRYSGTVKFDEKNYNYMTDKNEKLALFYKGSTYRFGKDIMEEEGLELIKRIKDYWRQ